MAKKILKPILCVLFFMAPFFVNTASAGMGGHPIPCGGPYPPCPVPLDSEVLLLLIAGAAYGGYKLYSSLKKNPA